MTFENLLTDRLRSPYVAARAWREQGKRVIGYIGDDIPVELILAAGALPLRLTPTPGAQTPQADQYLESSFGPAYRAFLESWLTGELDALDALVFPRSNDSAQRLYYYVCELQRRGVRSGPRSLIYDLARIPRDTSRLHTIAATHALASDLGVTESGLRPAFDRLASRTRLLAELTQHRTATEALTGSDALRVWRALQVDWTSTFEAQALQWIRSAPRSKREPRFLFAGSTPPDERFHRAVETAGGTIVEELFDESPAQCAQRWTCSSPTIEALAEGYREARSTAAQLLRSPQIIVERARAVGASGVILWLVEEDEGIVWEVPHQIDALRAADIPVLLLTRQRWDAGADCLARVQAFVQTAKSS